MIRRRTRQAFGLLALLVLVLGVVACGDDSDSEGSGNEATAGEGVAQVEFTGSIEDGLPECYPEPSEKNLRIGYASPLEANEAVNVQSQALKLETERLGGELVLIDAEGDVDRQVSAVEQLVAQDVDAIIAYPLDARALTPALKRAQAKSIPTVGIEANLDSTDQGPGLDTQVWWRRDYSSYLQATVAAELMPEDSTYGQIGFAVAVPTIEKQIERAAFWADKYGLTSAGRTDNPSDDIAGGEEAMTELLNQHPDIAGLIAYNEESATGAAAAARATGADLPLIGNNGGSLGFSSVESGRIDATVQMQVVDAAKCAVWGAYDLVEGERVPPTVLAAQPKLVTGDTIESVPTWEAQLSERYGETE